MGVFSRQFRPGIAVEGVMISFDGCIEAGTTGLTSEVICLVFAFRYEEHIKRRSPLWFVFAVQGFATGYLRNHVTHR